MIIIAGPCVIESEEHALYMAAMIRSICRLVGVDFTFKASFDKANRTSIGSYRGPGFAEGMRILADIKAETGVPVTSDIHERWQAAPAAEVLDIIQIPALLCRQTDLVIEAARTGKTVNLKKGQFMAPWDMLHAVEKVRSQGNEKVMVTERGTTFGYNNLVVDFRSIPAMKEFGCPVIFDASHSSQLPGAGNGQSDGQAHMIPVLARAAIAAGADGVFVEVHDSPQDALSDGPNSLALADLEEFLQGLLKLEAAR